MSNPNVRPIPEGMHSLTPHLVCADALGAIEFYKRAFDATAAASILTPDGRLMHGQIRIGDSVLMLMEENKDWGCLGPKSLGGSSVTIHLYVNDVDAVYKQAIAAGATVKMEPADQFWGDRYGALIDPYGHNWSIATHVRDMSPEEMKAGMNSMGDCPETPAQ